MPQQVIAVDRSSMISELGYDSSTGDLDVTFTNGSVYRYHGVPSSVFTNLAAAPSVGQFFTQQVKSRYAWEKLS